MSAPPAPDRWIQRPRPNPGARLRLFCLPHAGGAASAFRSWAGTLPDFVEVCPVQLPGRENRMREVPFTAWEPLVAALAEAVRPYEDRPFAVFGHSTGAMLGYELARTLRAAGRPGPVHLFASARRAPQIPHVQPTTYDLPEDALIDDLRSLGGVPEEVLAHRELMQIILPLLRADLSVNETYVHPGGEPLDVPVSAYGGTRDPRATREELEAWREQTRDRFTLRTFEGDHFYLQSDPAPVLAAVAEELAATAGRLHRD
jgi:medium-chain acyl-[acyl-carrier-protein] hydrolase